MGKMFKIRIAQIIEELWSIFRIETEKLSSTMIIIESPKNDQFIKIPSGKIKHEDFIILFTLQAIKGIQYCLEKHKEDYHKKEDVEKNKNKDYDQLKNIIVILKEYLKNPIIYKKSSNDKIRNKIKEYIDKKECNDIQQENLWTKDKKSFFTNHPKCSNKNIKCCHVGLKFNKFKYDGYKAEFIKNMIGMAIDITKIKDNPLIIKVYILSIGQKKEHK